MKEEASRDRRREQSSVAGSDDGTENRRDQEWASKQAAAIAKIFLGRCASRGGESSEFAGTHGVEDAGAGKRVDKA
jgi:hypothetical protein